MSSIKVFLRFFKVRRHVDINNDIVQGDNGGLALTLDSGPVRLLHWP